MSNHSDTPADEKKRIGKATIARLRQRGLDWELWLDAAVMNGKGVGVDHLYTNPAVAPDPNPAIHQWVAPDIRKWEQSELSGEGVHPYTVECLDEDWPPQTSEIAESSPD